MKNALYIITDSNCRYYTKYAAINIVIVVALFFFNLYCFIRRQQSQNYYKQSMICYNIFTMENSNINTPSLLNNLPANGQLPPPSKTLKQQWQEHFSNNKRRYKKALLGGSLAVIFLTGGGLGYKYAIDHPRTNQPQNVFVDFTLEIYDKVQQNYWDKIGNEQLSNIYKLAAEKLTGKPQELTSKDKSGVEALVTSIIADMEATKKKEFVTNLGDMVLANLSPFGRSRLYTTKREKEMRNTVANIDTNTNLYDVLGVNKDAKQDDIKKAFAQKTKELAADQSPEAKDKLAQVNRAWEALGKTEVKQVYDQAGIEPTVIGVRYEPDIFYIKIKRISPTTYDEFQKVAASTDKQPELTSLIVDLRANIGGAIDILPYFMGFFIGQNQYGYEFFHQGEPQPFKTKTGWLPSLVKFKKVVFLTDWGTQSSAEVIAASVKKYNVGVVMGATTKGWGTVENTFPLKTQIDPDESYSIFLVHSLTLRDDGQPIEGRGVDPVINMAEIDWPKQLLVHFNYQPLVDALKDITKDQDFTKRPKPDVPPQQ